MSEKSMDRLLDEAEKVKVFAKEVAQSIKNGEEFELRFDSIDLATAVNSELS